MSQGNGNGKRIQHASANHKGKMEGNGKLGYPNQTRKGEGNYTASVTGQPDSRFQENLVIFPNGTSMDLKEQYSSTQPETQISSSLKLSCTDGKPTQKTRMGEPIPRCKDQAIESLLLTSQKSVSNSYNPEEIDDCDGFSLKTHDEIDSTIGKLWRTLLKHIVILTFDEVNALRLTRSLQLILPFLTGYEAYTVAQAIEALDSGKIEDISDALGIAFMNRNVSRALVQSIRARNDFLWHWSTMMTWNRWFDAWGQLPVIGITRFPATENFPSTRNHALASIFRVLLGPGNWPTRVVTRGREALITDNPENVAQNLAAESNGFELANRNQYGTYFGRRKLNEFRASHRLPTDESLVRTFVAQPMSTMVNNGVVHVLNQLANHWHNMLDQPSGNFAHQRMEQLDPFETLRFHMPEVLQVLSSLRGRNHFDSKFIGGIVQRLQALSPDPTTQQAKKLVREIQTTVVAPVCGGVPSVINPFRSWLNAIYKACDLIEEEATKVYDLVSSVATGIRLGYKLYLEVSWKVPSDVYLKRLILDYIDGKYIPQRTKLRIQSALELTTPRDKRTLIELVRNNLSETRPAQLLLGRVKTLLQRELRREMLNKTIRQMSVGEEATRLIDTEWYWLEWDEKRALFSYDEGGSREHYKRFVQIGSDKEKLVPEMELGLNIRQYVAVGEAISQAQRAFLTIELEHGKRFTYSAFMEFSYLRKLLRRLVVVSQTTCEELDTARLNLLKGIQRVNPTHLTSHNLVPGTTYYSFNTETDRYEPYLHQNHSANDNAIRNLGTKKLVKVPPQNIMVIGGGPTGLLTTIHCTENVLRSGGIVRLYEARDSFDKGGSSFERAQIVRLDARWIAMLRYHLGTSFEDVFIPASGETDSQLGNSLPSQGFVEITIKNLESILHMEVSRLWSKGLISVFADAKTKFDSDANQIIKLGKYLKIDDLILRSVDENGRSSRKQYTWRVSGLVYSQPLGLDEIKVGEEYAVYVREESALLPFKFIKCCLKTKTYTFVSLTEGTRHLEVNTRNLPSIYTKDTKQHAVIHAVALKCTKKSTDGGQFIEELLMSSIQDEKFTLDVGNSHVIEAIGKPHNSKVHFQVTPEEPYGVLCMQGLKISMGMHNFGEKRWGNGALDDFRSQNDQNTRIIGDFTKMVRLCPITEKMYRSISSDENWRAHFSRLLAEAAMDTAGGTTTDAVASALKTIERACKWLSTASRKFRRQTLQTRFFETGDNFYLAMEFPREFERWKKKLVNHIAANKMHVATFDHDVENNCKRLETVLAHHLDRLFFESSLETIRMGDVYNSGARHRVPHLYVINSYFDTDLGSLPVGESFRLTQNPEELYEILVKKPVNVVARNSEGYIFQLSPATPVRREGNLTRTPDGNTESKVAIATFLVSHYVNYRTMRLNDSTNGYVLAFAGDEQATPHFMRYSGLTGAAINAMLFNNFLQRAIDGIGLMDRFASYSNETNWSNGEVVQRGTGSNFGFDGFLRPGFSYEDVVDYLAHRIEENKKSGQDPEKILTRDWKAKIAASLIPRGMELNEHFLLALRLHLRFSIFNKLFGQANPEWKVSRKSLDWTLKRVRHGVKTGVADTMDWDGIFKDMQMHVNDDMKKTVAEEYIPMAKSLERACNQVIDHARAAYLYDERLSSQLLRQPKSVDSIFDDFAVEAQNFANSLMMSVAFSSVAITFRLVGTNAANVMSTIVGFLNIFLSFETMTNVARYKIRNEEARILFFDKLKAIKKSLFAMMDTEEQDLVLEQWNPFLKELNERICHFQNSARYYDLTESKELNLAYKQLKNSNYRSGEEIRKFQLLLSSGLIVDTYHINSYLQQDLVEIYKVLDEMVFLLSPTRDREQGAENAKILFEDLNRFTPRLDKSLQRGPIRWGFVKQREVAHWDIIVVLRYLYSILCYYLAVPTTWTPIENDISNIIKKAKACAASCEPSLLCREIQDFEELYYATHESDVASMIFVSACSVFVASLLFSAARVLDFQRLEKFAYWATAPSASGATVATFHFIRKLRILCDLWIILGRKVMAAQNIETRINIQKIRCVTLAQIVLTKLRLGAAFGAAIALAFSIAENGYSSTIRSPSMVAFWIALGIVLMAIIATIFFFVVEYVIRYNLSPTLPVTVVGSFREEIDEIYWIYRRPWNDIDTKQAQEKKTWEYVARNFLHKYRFDTVFAADRFGSILQHIQSGMESPSGINSNKIRE